jgi:hypothetical protein
LLLVTPSIPKKLYDLAFNYFKYLGPFDMASLPLLGGFGSMNSSICGAEAILVNVW